MNSYQLYKIQDWEKAKPEEVSFSRFFLTERSGEVRKVIGTIRILKKKLVNGLITRVPSTRRALWDGFGRCYVGTHNLRKRDYDIPLRAKM